MDQASNYAAVNGPLDWLFVFVWLLICAISVIPGRQICRRVCGQLDLSLRIGVYGLVGLGVTGTLLALFTAVGAGVPMSLGFIGTLYGIGQKVLVRSGAAKRPAVRYTKPERLEWLAVGVLALCVLLNLLVLLAPSTAADWDSIAYHLAVPKLYLAQHNLAHIATIHHSNFPEVVEMLFLPGLAIKSQAAAKATLLAFTLFGYFAIFGFTRDAYGKPAAWWATVAFATVPTVLWEGATAYIDVAHGLFIGVGILLVLQSAVKNQHLWIPAGLLLGFGCASKYNGLQAVILIVLILVFLMWRKVTTQGWKPALIVVLLPALVAGPWYVRNIIASHNPVYPFLYEQFGGQGWDERRASIYRDQQLLFGVGVNKDHKDWSQLGHAIFGLTYQPGRYVDPDEVDGGGSPLGAIGVSVFAGLLFWALVKRPGAFEGAVLAYAGLSFILWFALSQQSRYIITLAVPASVLLGAAATTKGIGRLAAAVAAGQAAFTLWLYDSSTVANAIPVAVGKVAPLDYLHTALPWSLAAESINELPVDSKVALYDQVFGFYLDRPYVWANPPHSMLIPYDSMRSGADYVLAIRRLGFTHVYVQFVGDETDATFAAALGYFGQPTALPDELRAKWKGDWIQVWKVWLAEAVANGQIKPVKTFKKGMLFEIPPVAISQVPTRDGGLKRYPT
jgi:hypothetical protein